MKFTDGKRIYQCESKTDWIDWSYDQYNHPPIGCEDINEFIKQQVNMHYDYIKIADKEYEPCYILEKIDPKYLCELMNQEIELIGEHVENMLNMFDHCDLMLYDDIAHTSRTFRTFKKIKE